MQHHTNVAVATGSGFTLLDASALEAVRRASLFPRSTGHGLVNAICIIRMASIAITTAPWRSLLNWGNDASRDDVRIAPGTHPNMHTNANACGLYLWHHALCMRPSHKDPPGFYPFEGRRFERLHSIGSTCLPQAIWRGQGPIGARISTSQQKKGPVR